MKYGIIFAASLYLWENRTTVRYWCLWIYFQEEFLGHIIVNMSKSKPKDKKNEAQNLFEKEL
jgi:hypothetical protein